MLNRLVVVSKCQIQKNSNRFFFVRAVHTVSDWSLPGVCDKPSKMFYNMTVQLLNTASVLTRDKNETTTHNREIVLP